MSEQHSTEPEKHEDSKWPTPRIYVASLSDYNAGRLHGTWLNADDDPEDLLSGIEDMLARSPEPVAEQWAIHDFDGFGTLRLSESEDIDYVSRLGKGLVEHGPAFAAFADQVGDDELLDSFEDCYRGQWGSVEEYAEELMEDIGVQAQVERAVGESLRPYVKIDYQALARDMEISGELMAVSDGSGGVYLFTPG